MSDEQKKHWMPVSLDDLETYELVQVMKDTVIALVEEIELRLMQEAE